MNQTRIVEIKMPADIFEGTECMDCEVPWQTPDSIYKEAINLFDDDKVLEVGTGGSTFFFARRTGYVISLETDPIFFQKVNDKLFNENLFNVVENYFLNDEQQIIDFISTKRTDDITVFSVDPQGHINRSNVLNAFLNKGISPNFRMLVLDNYGHEGIFPDHYNKIIDLGEGWEVFTYDYDRWAGNGTRIYIKTQH
jgi:hypothetical protein